MVGADDARKAVTLHNRTRGGDVIVRFDHVKNYDADPARARAWAVVASKAAAFSCPVQANSDVSAAVYTPGATLNASSNWARKSDRRSGRRVLDRQLQPQVFRFAGTEA